MEKRETSALKPLLRSVAPQNWEGRSSILPNEYWHQLVQLNPINIPAKSYTLIGYACDEGVRRNQGRVGAKEGPNAIRKALAKFPIHFEGKSISDLGDVVCEGNNLEASQDNLSNIVKDVIKADSFPIVLGGGHDVAYAHGKGLAKALLDSKNNTLGIVNFDAHFDLRPVDEHATSGTPFSQLLEEFPNGAIQYLPIGIQKQGNTQSLFKRAEALGVHYIPFEKCSSLESIKSVLQRFIDSCTHLYITIDLDGFSSAIAPGVSAANPIGLQYTFAEEVLAYLIKSTKVVALDVAEMNPLFDNDNQTAKLAARLIDFCVQML